jgi:hypothetical protein
MIGLGLDADGVGGSAPIVRQHPRHRGREKCRLSLLRFTETLATTAAGRVECGLARG